MTYINVDHTDEKLIELVARTMCQRMFRESWSDLNQAIKDVVGGEHWQLFYDDAEMLLKCIENYKPYNSIDIPFW